MRHMWVCLALFLSSPTLANSLPEGAEQRMLPSSERIRLMRLFAESMKTEGAKQRPLYNEQRHVSDQLMAELYGPSPDLALIERLDKRLKELARQSQQSTADIEMRFYRGLSLDDRLKFMKMNHALPPIIVLPDKPKGAGKTPTD